MNRLPHGLAEPLHILEPVPWTAIVGAAIGLLVLAVVLWGLLRRRRRRPMPEAPAATLPAPSATGFERVVDEVRRRALESRDFRAGCHELSARAREHVGARRGRRFSILTAREIGHLLGDTAVARLLRLIADLQFGRRPPSRSDFEGACELAVEVITRQGGDGA